MGARELLRRRAGVMAPMQSTEGAASVTSDAIGPRHRRVHGHRCPPRICTPNCRTGCAAILATELRKPQDEVALDCPFAEMGLNSVMAMSIRREVEQLVGIELSATMLWNHPTIASLARYLAEKLLPQEMSDGDDVVHGSTDSVLDTLFDSVESTSASS